MYVMGRKQLNVSCNTQYVHVQKVDEQTAKKAPYTTLLTTALAKNRASPAAGAASAAALEGGLLLFVEGAAMATTRGKFIERRE